MRALLILLALAALVATGCGGSQTSTYKSEYSKAAADFKRSVDEASAKIPNAPTLKDRIPALVSFKGSIDKLASRLASLDPPDNVKKLNDQAVAGLKQLSVDLDRLRAAAEASDAHEVKQIAPRLQVDQARLQDVLDEIDQKLKG